MHIYLDITGNTLFGLTIPQSKRQGPLAITIKVVMDLVQIEPFRKAPAPSPTGSRRAPLRAKTTTTSSACPLAHLHTVCESALPQHRRVLAPQNRTFMMLGNLCTAVAAFAPSQGPSRTDRF